ncbi:MAG: PEP-CTERM sorting domain-containing protein [Nitrosospira sp.]
MIRLRKGRSATSCLAFGSLFILASAVHAANDTFDGNAFAADYGVSTIGPTSLIPLYHADATGSTSAVEIPSLSGWSIDTMGDTLSLTWNRNAEFMNSGSPAFIGFKISDTGNHLADILGVSVTNTTYMPSTYGNLVEGFQPSQVTFDANNIYVNLNTAMWHAAPMASMGDPFRDKIALSVNFQHAAPISEPETYAMLLAGLGLMGAVVRRRRSGK